jgi:hypothetical protein
MKIKNLPPQTNMTGIKIKIPDGHPEYDSNTGYWVSQWGYPDGKAGVWLKKNLNETRIYPIFLDKLDEVLEWDVAD